MVNIGSKKKMVITDVSCDGRGKGTGKGWWERSPRFSLWGRKKNHWAHTMDVGDDVLEGQTL